MITSWSYSSQAVGRQEPSPEQTARLSRRQVLSGTPENMLPATWPLAILLAHTDEIAISVLGAQIYPAGMTFSYRVASRRQQDDPHALEALPFHVRRAQGELEPDNILRLGIRYSDGRSWSSLGQPDLQQMVEVDSDNATPTLMPMGGSGNGRTYDQRMYLNPLPPDGPLEFFCAWPRHSIPETSATVNVIGISAAANNAIQLWPLDEAEP